MFVADQINMCYSHNERMVVGGAAPVSGAVVLPVQSDPVAGAPFLETAGAWSSQCWRRRSGKITVDGEVFEMKPRDGLYVPDGIQ